MVDEPDASRSQDAFARADAPIEDRSQDRLNRGRLADAIADQVIHGPRGLGLVIGIAGKWGSGKTSILRMVEQSVRERSETIIVTFNPWLFSTTDQLVTRFLDELGTQLRGKAAASPAGDLLKSAGDQLSTYAEAIEPLGWLPLIGPWLLRFGYAGRTYKSVQKARRTQPTAEGQREAVSKVLRSLDQRVLVVIDDLDRIEPGDIRDMVRLVKLVGDFPNTTYLLAYDSDPVEHALGDTPERGREYLEKIVQVIHDIPQPPPEALQRMLFEELQVIVDTIPTGPFRTEDWQNILPDGIRPFFQTARDVRRYLNSVPVTLRVIGAEVALVDVLALEAIRVFAPRAYAELPASVATLSGAHNIGGAAQAEVDRVDVERINAIVDAAGEHSEPTKAILRRLFPCIGHHLGGSRVSGYEQQARRLLSVADHNILRTYLERTLPEGVISGVLVGEAASILGDRNQLAALFETLDAETAEGLIQRLEDYEHEFDPDVVEPAIPALLNELPRLREGRRGMFDTDSDMIVGRLVLRLLRRVADELRLDIVERALPDIASLTGRMKLADIAGHRENVGHGLIAESDAVRLYATLEQQIMDATPDQLAGERALFTLFLRIAQDKRDDGITWIRAACAHDSVLLRLLRSQLGAQQSQTLGEYAVRTRPSLPWELFETWLDAVYLRERINRLAELDSAGWDARAIEALQTAQAYASGEISNRTD